MLITELYNYEKSQKIIEDTIEQIKYNLLQNAQKIADRRQFMFNVNFGKYLLKVQMSNDKNDNILFEPMFDLLVLTYDDLFNTSTPDVHELLQNFNTKRVINGDMQTEDDLASIHSILSHELQHVMTLYSTTDWQQMQDMTKQRKCLQRHINKLEKRGVSENILDQLYYLYANDEIDARLRAFYVMIKDGLYDIDDEKLFDKAYDYVVYYVHKKAIDLTKFNVHFDPIETKYVPKELLSYIRRKVNRMIYSAKLSMKSE